MGTSLEQSDCNVKRGLVVLENSRSSVKDCWCKGLLFIVHNLVTDLPLGTDVFQNWRLLQRNIYLTEEEIAV